MSIGALRRNTVARVQAKRWLSSAIPPARLRVHRVDRGLVLIRPAGLEDTGRLQPGAVFRVPGSSPQSSSSVVVMFKMKDAMFGAQLGSGQSFKSGDVLEQQNEEKLMMDNEGEISTSEVATKRVFDDPPRDMARRPITKSWFLGIPVMDLMTPIGIGQSMIFFEALNGPLFSEILQRMPSDRRFMPESIVPDSIFNQNQDRDLAYMLGSYYALTRAELERDRGQGRATLVVIKDVSPFRRVWERAQRMLSEESGMDGKGKIDGGAPTTLSSFLQRIDRSDLRHYYSSFIQRAARLKDSEGSVTMLLRSPHVEKPAMQTSTAGEQVFNLEEFEREVKAGVRALEDFERLVRLQVKLGTKLKLTAATLNKLQIPLPASAFSQATAIDFVEESTKAKLHGEELMSIVDGHVVSPEGFSDFLLDPRASLTRIGAGSGQNEVRDTRPELVRAVAGGLRIEIADLYESVHANPAKAKQKLEGWKQSLNCFQDNHGENGRGWKQQAAIVWATRKGWYTGSPHHGDAKVEYDLKEVDKLELNAEDEPQTEQFKRCIKSSK